MHQGFNGVSFRVEWHREYREEKNSLWRRTLDQFEQIKHGAGFDRLISSPKWLLVPHPARQYQPANPAPSMKIPASVFFFDRNALSALFPYNRTRYLRRRHSPFPFKKLDTGTILSTTSSRSIFMLTWKFSLPLREIFSAVTFIEFQCYTSVCNVLSSIYCAQCSYVYHDMVHWIEILIQLN